MQPMNVLVEPPKSRRAGLVIGLLLIGAGIFVGLVLVVNGVRGVADTVRDYQRVPMSTGGSITIREPGTYRIFLEYPGANDALTTSPGGFVTITGPSGPVPVLPDSSTQSYGLNGREGRQLGKFEADVAGTYDVRTIARDGDVAFGDVAIGRTGPLTGLASIVGGLFAGFVLVAVGVIVLIVRAVRRSRDRRPYGGMPAAPPGWGNPVAPPVPGWGAPAPGQGWGGPPPGQAGGSWGAPQPPPPSGQSWTPPPSPPTANEPWTPPAGTPPPAGEPWSPPPSQAWTPSPTSAVGAPTWTPPPEPVTPPPVPSAPWGESPPTHPDPPQGPVSP